MIDDKDEPAAQPRQGDVHQGRAGIFHDRSPGADRRHRVHRLCRGFRSVYIDMEHSPFLEAAGQICMACNHLGVTPWSVSRDGPVLHRQGHGLRCHGHHRPRRAVRRGGAHRCPCRQTRAPGRTLPAGAPPQLLYRAFPPSRPSRCYDTTSHGRRDDRIPGGSERGGGHRRRGGRRRAPRRGAMTSASSLVFAGTDGPPQGARHLPV